jgi:hypothetical protein
MNAMIRVLLVSISMLLAQGAGAFDRQEQQSQQSPAATEHSGKGYINSSGDWTPSPKHTLDGKPPPGASAQCRDGSYSFSAHHRGTCSHHGGVARWL